MKRTILGLVAATLLVGCRSGSDVRTSPAATALELRVLDTLRELDEKSDGLLASARFGTTRKELNAFADIASHAHSKRSDEIKAWRTSAFPTAPKDVALPVCAQRSFAVPSAASDFEILDAMIAHRACAVAFTNESLPNVKSASARHLVEEITRTWVAEEQTLRAWRSAWK